ncbi:MAG: amidohydrolase family protein [Actinomycetota bacterium]
MLTLRNARLPTGATVDLVVDDRGVIVEAVAPGTSPPGEGDLDLEGRLALPAPAEPHAHLDKALTADLVPNPAGDLMGAIEAWRARYDERTPDEIADRARRAVRLGLANGLTAVRTHVDVGEAIGLRAIEALAAVREEVAGVVDLQIVALAACPLAGPDGSGNRGALEAAIEAGVDVVGGCPHLDDDPASTVDLTMRLAVEAGLPIDLHVDETLDPTARSLVDIGRWIEHHGAPPGVAASHCVSLGMQERDEQDATAALLAATGVDVIALPQTNLFLQAREQATAPPRGLTAVGALRGAGVNVAGGADNLQDPFNTVGRADPLETAALLVMAAHVEPEVAYAMVSERARAAMALPAAGTEPGHCADLLVLPATTVRDAVATAPAERMVLRRGRLVARTTVDRHVGV